MSELRNLPNAQIQLERKEAERAGTTEESPVVTPLMEFIRQKRAAKGGPRYVPRNNCGKGSRSGKEKSTYVQVNKRDDQQPLPITNGLSSVKYVGSPKHLRRRGPPENLQSLDLEVEFWFLVLSVSSFMNGLVSSSLESKRRHFLLVYLEKEDLLTWVLDFIVLIRRHDFSKSVFNDRTVIVCDQCEREYHIRCLSEHKMADLEALPKGRWFCKEDCERIHYVLQDLLIHEPEIVHEELLTFVRKKEKKGKEKEKEKEKENENEKDIAELPIVATSWRPEKKKVSYDDIQRHIHAIKGYTSPLT
ncbi:hypothetical protein LXL04_033778 [Taraxacum kok-saghyz]